MPLRQEFLFHLDRPQRAALVITETGWRLEMDETPWTASASFVHKGGLIAEIAAHKIALTPQAVCRLAALHEHSEACWALCLALGGAAVRDVVDLTVQQLEVDRAGWLCLTDRGDPDPWIAKWGDTGPCLLRPTILDQRAP
jgi:hypothetical protein